VGLVKQAETELAAESLEIEKVAAMDELLAAGVDFDSAVELVKEAADTLAIEDKTLIPASKRYLKALKNKVVGTTKRYANAVKTDTHRLVKGTQPGTELEASRRAAGARLAKNPLLLGGLAATGALAGGIALKHKLEGEKQAALGELLAAGVDFDSAVELVTEAVESL
jgi:hypothetical protein